MVVLPANEFIDDHCIRDSRSRLGDYKNHKFTNQDHSIEELISENLNDCDYVEVEKEEGVKQKSYGVGEGIFIIKPLGSNQTILFLAVTTKRAKEGLSAEMSYILQAVRKIQHIAADIRVNSVYIPVMGSGHCGLRSEVALFALLLAICDTITQTNGTIRKW